MDKNNSLSLYTISKFQPSETNLTSSFPTAICLRVCVLISGIWSQTYSVHISVEVKSESLGSKGVKSKLNQSLLQDEGSLLTVLF